MNNQRQTSNGVNHWLSRRHPRYIRSLVYMLQASEYNIADFFRWHERTDDFRRVEKRKTLVFTPKATALYAFGWLAVFMAFSLAVFVFINVASPWNIVLSALLVLEVPLIAMVCILSALVVGRIFQYPLELLIVAHAQMHLKGHKGVKIAIAGSYGKTSTREILKTVLSEGRSVAAPPGSYNTPLGIASFVRGLKGNEDVLIFELGEYYPGDVEKLARMINPEWGIITGVNEAHLEKFGTLEQTADTIFKLAESVEPSRLYVNGDSELARARAKSGNIVYTREGIAPPAGGWHVSDARTDLQGMTFKLSKAGSVFEVKSGLLGLHMLAPLVLATDLASRLGLSDNEIVTGIAKPRPFAHRLEPKGWGDGVTFLDDSYNGNPDGVRAAIRFLQSLKGRRFYVTPGLVEAGSRVQEIHHDIGRELAGAGIEKVVLIQTGVAPYIEAGLKSAGFRGELLSYDDMPSCLAALRALALPGDIILVQNDWPDQYA